MIQLLLSVALLAGAVSGKTVFSAVSVNGVYQGQGVGVRVPASNNGIMDVTSPDLICNTNYLQPVSPTVISVPAGAQVTAHFHHKSAGYLGPDPSDPLDPTNKGPVLAYLAKIPSATQPSVTGLKWFKVFEDGLNPDLYQWGSEKLYVAKGNATFTLPSCLQAGDYLLRVEAINLLDAWEYPGAQFYMSCAQITISSPSTTEKAPATVSFPGAYTSDDPGIVTTIFGLDSYTPPGPAVFTC